MPSDRPNSNLEHSEILRTARDLAYDDYLADLLAPERYREDLLTVAAMFGEFAKLPLQVSDATLGEIRFQWWRDALASGTKTGAPLADALVDIQARLGLPLAEVVAPALEARAAELYAEPFPDRAAFDAYVVAPERAHMRLRAAIMKQSKALDTHGDATSALLDDAARVIGLVRTCCRLPLLFAKGRYPLHLALQGGSGETVDEAALRAAMAGLAADAATTWGHLRPRIKRISPELRPLILPVALAGPYLRVLQSVGHDLLRHIAEPSPLERSTRLWLAARVGWF
jgi:phytoene synthase